jgi:capsular polysaccharide biosynthesis protein
MCVAVSPGFGFVGDSRRQSRKKMRAEGYVFHDGGDLTLPNRQVVAVDFPAVHIGLASRRNYFHWLFEGLGRFLIVRDLLPDDARVAVSPGLAAFEAETLALVGVAPEAVFELPPGRIVQFSQLYVPSRSVGRDWALLPMVANALRELAGRRTVRHRRLYVTRVAAQDKRIVNDADVMATLTRHGFVEVQAERLSVREQIEIFSQAEAVIGAHGAGLTNAVFSAPGTLLIELQAPELGKAEPIFWNMAAISGLRYVQVVCKAIPPGGRHSDIEVDCSHLDAVLRRRLPTD